MNDSEQKKVGFWPFGPSKPKIVGPWMASFNMNADLLGDPDTRPTCWGRAAFVDSYITFNPPVGYRVRILRVSGDFMVFPKVIQPQSYQVPPPTSGFHTELGGMPAMVLDEMLSKYAGALLALGNTSSDGSQRADFISDNTFLYIQIGTDGRAVRAEYDRDVSINGLLEADHKMKVRNAVFLNTLELPVHMEPTFIVTYQWELA